MKTLVEMIQLLYKEFEDCRLTPTRRLANLSADLAASMANDNYSRKNITKAVTNEVAFDKISCYFRYTQVRAPFSKRHRGAKYHCRKYHSSAQCQDTKLKKGESFYNPYIPGVTEVLSNAGLVEESEGARVIFIEGKKIPLIVVKRDGGFNYASTDLLALWYRLNEEKVEWMIYVTDVGQREHFEMVFTLLFQAAKRVGWLPANDNTYPKTSHVGFGLVLGDDGKRFQTRSTEVVKLVDLLDEAKIRCKAALVERGKADEWSEEELNQTAEAVGYGAVKYADLKNNRLTNYTFKFDQMLNDKGNTAVYLLYAHARICSIIRKSGKDIEELKKMRNEVVVKDVASILKEAAFVLTDKDIGLSNIDRMVLCDFMSNEIKEATGSSENIPADEPEMYPYMLPLVRLGQLAP